jgi:hypothetical protein
MSIFILLTVMFQIQPYCQHLDEYCEFAFTFGTSLVTATYFFSSFFDNTNGAIRCIVPFYLIIGTLIPMSLTVYIYKTPDMKKHFFDIHTPMIFCNPFYAFFFINYSFIRHKMVNDWAEYIRHYDYTPAVASKIFQGQAVFFFLGTLLIDYIRNNKFRCADKRKPRLIQP